MTQIAIDPQTTKLWTAWKASHSFSYQLSRDQESALQRRLDRALDIDIMTQVRWVGPVPDGQACCMSKAQSFFVESTTQPGRYYDLSIMRGCSCPDAAGDPDIPQGKLAPWGWCKHRFALWAWFYQYHLQVLGQDWAARPRQATRDRPCCCALQPTE